nr:linear amide C-N hydrolase [Ruegeria atlantica]
MTLSYKISRLTLSLLNAVCVTATASIACTGITLTGQDGTVVFSRTMEWGTFDMEGEFAVIPRGMELTATKMNDGKEGIGWVSKYGVAGITGLGKLIMGDATNETGLTVGIFTFLAIPNSKRMTPNRPGYRWLRLIFHYIWLHNSHPSRKFVKDCKKYGSCRLWSL